MFKSGKVSQLLNVSQSTLRYLVRTYSEYLSEMARKSRRRYFSDADISILSKILLYQNEGQSFSEIAKKLRASVDESQVLENKINTIDLRLLELENKFQEITEIRSELTIIKKSLKKQKS